MMYSDFEDLSSIVLIVLSNNTLICQFKLVCLLNAK